MADTSIKRERSTDPGGPRYPIPSGSKGPECRAFTVSMLGIIILAGGNCLVFGYFYPVGITTFEVLKVSVFGVVMMVWVEYSVVGYLDLR